jgi:hypothetical protein
MTQFCVNNIETSVPTTRDIIMYAMSFRSISIIFKIEFEALALFHL